MTSTATAGDRSIRTSNDIVGQPAGTLSLTTLVPEVEETIHPTLFEVANDTGIPVFDLIDYSRTTRTIDPGTIVLGLARVQRATNEDSLWAKTWLRIPDGWIDDDVVREVCPVRL
jgi:hypothetical protein